MRETPFTKKQMKEVIYLGALAWLLLVVVYVAQIFDALPQGRVANLIAGAVYIFPIFFGLLIYQKRKNYLKEKDVHSESEDV